MQSDRGETPRLLTWGAVPERLLDDDPHLYLPGADPATIATTGHVGITEHGDVAGPEVTRSTAGTTLTATDRSTPHAAQRAGGWNMNPVPLFFAAALMHVIKLPFTRDDSGPVSAAPPLTPRDVRPKRAGLNIGELGCLFAWIAGVAALSPPCHGVALVRQNEGAITHRYAETRCSTRGRSGREQRGCLARAPHGRGAPPVAKKPTKRVLHSTPHSTVAASPTRTPMYRPRVSRHGLAAETAGWSIKNAFCRLFLRPSRCFATRRHSRTTAATRRDALAQLRDDEQTRLATGASLRFCPSHRDCLIFRPREG
jgi:hypothetical protein